MPTPLCDASRRLLSYPRVFICSPSTMLLSRQSITRNANRDPNTARSPEGIVFESGRCVANTNTIPAAGPFFASHVNNSPTYSPAVSFLLSTRTGVRSSNGTWTSSRNTAVIGMFNARSRDIAGVTFVTGHEPVRHLGRPIPVLASLEIRHIQPRVRVQNQPRRRQPSSHCLALPRNRTNQHRRPHQRQIDPPIPSIPPERHRP